MGKAAQLMERRQFGHKLLRAAEALNETLEDLQSLYDGLQTADERLSGVVSLNDVPIMMGRINNEYVQLLTWLQLAHDQDYLVSDGTLGLHRHNCFKWHMYLQRVIEKV